MILLNLIIEKASEKLKLNILNTCFAIIVLFILVSLTLVLGYLVFMGFFLDEGLNFQ